MRLKMFNGFASALFVPGVIKSPYPLRIILALSAVVSYLSDSTRVLGRDFTNNTHLICRSLLFDFHKNGWYHYMRFYIYYAASIFIVGGV